MPSRVARCHVFCHHFQAEGKTINQYIAVLRTAALYCEFRDLENLLLDQLICGVRDIHLQRRLLAKTDVTLQTALDEARASELSNRSATEIQKSLSPSIARKTTAVHHDEVDSDLSSDEGEEVSHLKITPRRGWGSNEKKSQVLCVGCGGNHHRSACKFKNAECRRCGKKGHLAKVCRAAQPANNNPARTPHEYRPHNRQDRRGEDCFTIYRGTSHPETIIDQASTKLKKKTFPHTPNQGEAM